MSATYNYRYVLRAVVEFVTPFLLGAGRSGDIADAVFVADANGLPAIPGSSLAGVLRAAFRENGGSDDDDNSLFGFQSGRQGSGSRLVVSWGCIHDAGNTPVEGIVPPRRLDDPVLAKAMSPGIRDHVRINHRGASDAEERGKFDEQAVCAGHRFTFELELVGSKSDQGLWDQLLRVLANPALRLGGKTRRGYGAFRFESVKSRVFNLDQDFPHYRQHPVSLAQPSNVLSDLTLQHSGAGAVQTVALQLKPSGYWMFGGGYDLAADPGEADMAPVRDCRIVWTNGRGTVQEDLLVIPATGIKGALAHRVAFHYNALTGAFSDGRSAVDLEDVAVENNLAVRELFGYCKGRSTDGKETKEAGRRGRVILDDLYVDAGAAPRAQLVHHVGIDRFTGGARDQVLFCERPLWQGEFPDLQFHIVGGSDIQDRKVIEALKRAVKDLTEGRLQVGAGSGRGNGFFTGTCTWPDSLDS